VYGKSVVVIHIHVITALIAFLLLDFGNDGFDGRLIVHDSRNPFNNESTCPVFPVQVPDRSLRSFRLFE
jgi:hypothetical protein